MHSKVKQIETPKLGAPTWEMGDKAYLKSCWLARGTKVLKAKKGIMTTALFVISSSSMISVADSPTQSCDSMCHW